MWSALKSACAPEGSRIVLVKAYVADYAPAVRPHGDRGTSARTRQWKIPVPYMSTGVKAGLRKPVRSRCVPSGRSAELVYETAPGTTFHAQVGMKLPCVGLSGLPTGAGSRFWKVETSDHVRPTPFSSFARTRQ